MIASSEEVVEERVVTLVAGLVEELGGAAARMSVTGGASLERDLGIGSLERVELLVRLEEAFGVRLPDSVMTAAETPRDLARAVLAAEPAAAVLPPPVRAALGLATPAPASAATLTEVLAWHAERHPERTHAMLAAADGTEHSITYGDLWARGLAIAAGLRDQGVRTAEPVALMLRTEPAFLAAFVGVLVAGGIPVPLYPPYRPDRISEYMERQAGILRNAGARVLITFPEAERVGGLLRGQADVLSRVLSVKTLGSVTSATPRGRAGNDPALIQYTSGSTGAPKGVLLSHANLLANIRAIGEAIAVRPDDVAVSWLPLYHDMGLIGAWLGSLYHGIPVALLSPLSFLARPSRWLWALHSHRGTVSPAPNFAFDLCVRKIAESELEGLDLRAWRLALNGSEPVSADTITRFTRRFGPSGFRAAAMCPVYGLAEASVALTASTPGTGARVERLDRTALRERHRAEVAETADPRPVSLVACGHALPAHEVRIADTAGRSLPDRTEGRILFRGPSVTAGYWRNPAATAALFDGEWADSGDLGYLAEGDLFITGRHKDLIIKGGRNLAPQEVEELAGQVPGVRAGCVAALGIPDPAIGTERLVVIAESRAAAVEERERLRAAVVRRVAEGLGLPPDVVVIVAPGTVLKTPSGKVRRAAMCEAFVRGDLEAGRPSARVQWVRLRIAALGRRTRRLLGQAWAGAYGMYVGLLLLATMPALWLAVLLARSPAAADRRARGWCRTMLRLSGCPLRTEGLERLRYPAVLVANHASYLDVVALLAAVPGPYAFVAKRELTRAPVVGAVIRKAEHLTAERGDPARAVADATRAIARLQGGTSLFVFPEGTFVRHPGTLPFRLGAFKAAVDTGCPVIPIALIGTREVLPDGAWLPTPGPITVSVGLPLTPRGAGWTEIVRLRDEARAAIARRTGEPSIGRE
jgi:acyl carrier protein